MSQGRFSRTFYELDNGNVAPVRIQPETEACLFDGTANAAPAGPATEDCFAQTRKSKRAYGIGCRTVTAEWTGTPPTGYDDRGNLTIPVLTSAVYDGITIFSTGTYQGASITIIGKSGESIR